MSATDFVPADYEVPKGNNKFFKPKPGENRVRILDKPLLGYVGWVQEGTKRKPVRREVPEFAGIPVELEKVRHFWALPVWDYASKTVSVWEITQSSIQTPLRNLARDPDWGPPMHYDIAVVRTGEGMDTEYAVVPKPKKALGKEAREAWEEASKTFDLTELFKNGDPFKGTGDAVQWQDGPPPDDDIPF